MSQINKDVNYKKIAGDARLVMIGESSHSTEAYKYEAMKALKQLKAAGFTHFAIEMLPRIMQESIDFYQRTGNGFNVIQKYFDQYWTHGYLVPHSYGELVKTARTVGLKIIALDITVDEMSMLDDACSYDNAKAKLCFDTHTKRNISWASTIGNILKESNQNRVVAFMSRWHAVEAAAFQEGLDTLVKKQGVRKVRFIDYIGGITCLSERDCRNTSNENSDLKQEYFYREGFPHKAAVMSFQVHIPEKRVSSSSALVW
jgi:uncharacterized iron-regulated protein